MGSETKRQDDGRDLLHDDALDAITTRDIGLGVGDGVAVGPRDQVTGDDTTAEPGHPSGTAPSPTIPDVGPGSTARR